VTFVAVTIIHSHVMISTVTVIASCCGLSVVRSRSFQSFMQKIADLFGGVAKFSYLCDGE
jgi:putative Mn2+ efflux pump MntP